MLEFLSPYADTVIAVTQVVISAAVVPTIWAGRKFQGVPLTTSGLLSPGLYIIAACMLSHDLPLAAATTAFGATMWGIVGLQRIWPRRGKRCLVDGRYVLVSTPGRSLAKGLTWEVTGLVTVAAVALLVTGNLLAALAIGGVVFPVRVGMYFLHERLWKHFRWGHRCVVRD